VPPAIAANTGIKRLHSEPLNGSNLFERILCPRIHTKAVVIDGNQAFIGSANLTGAGLGAKGRHKHNFEAGMLTGDPSHLRELMEGGFSNRKEMGTL
jgi:phosphatidylserine/phosphatidylglycerophosphate/cardiolipin synthase-like enzyme